MKRKCVRCGVLQEYDRMHHNKQLGWLCDNRVDCTKRLEGLGMTEIIMPFTRSSCDKIKAGIKTATTRKTRYGVAGNTFMVAGVRYRITGVRKLMLVRVAFDWFKEEGFGSPEDFVEAWVLCILASGICLVEWSSCISLRKTNIVV